MKYVTDEITRRFQYRQRWGAKDHGWNSGKSDGVRFEGDSSDSPWGPYTGAWFLDATFHVRAYTRNDEDITDKRVYVQIRMDVAHNKLWTSADIEQNGFIDIGGIYFMPANIPPIGADGHREYMREFYHPFGDYSTGAPVYLHNGDASLSQMESDIGVSPNSAIVRMLIDNGTRQGMIYAGSNNSGWGVHHGTDVAPYSFDFTIPFTPDQYDDDGKMKIENIQIPLYIASRYVDVDPPRNVVSRIVTLFDFDLVGDGPFQFVPWARRMPGGTWRSCNDGKTLSTRQSGNWNHIVYNNALNPHVPGDSNGFRVQSSQWAVSPITPS